MKITLNIPDSKAFAFIEFVKSLEFISIENEENIYDAIPTRHMSIVEERLIELEKNPDTLLNLDQELDKLDSSL